MALICLYKLYKNGGHEWLQISSKCSSELLWYKAAFSLPRKTTLLQKNWHVILVKSVQLCPTASSKQMLHTVT